ncbi:SDR family oxidoreductase [Arthrobacter sp. H14]|uniref:SDR family oxidoreductase n=1 Tax=Arthrobacter sp. H14 TaxID=1312959 RepID=UPI00047E08CF|nr:SDR family oxidoreductase [Arthrobacter sp. H14]
MSRPIALITGVGRTVGIAAGISRKLAAEGWDLALTYWAGYDDRMPWGSSGSSGATLDDGTGNTSDDDGGGPAELRTPDMVELTSELEAMGAEVFSVQADFEQPDAVPRLVAAVHAGIGPFGAVVLSHCESVDSGILTTSVDSFDRHYAVNVRASWQLIAEFARQLPGDDGRIVALTSDHTVENLPYGSSKGALDRIVIAAARELGHLGITSNALNPGPIDTGWMDAELREQLTLRQPTGRLGTPADTADLVGFLLSPEGKWISGQLIKSDGGFSV